MSMTQLGSKDLMSIVKIKENNVAQEFYVVRHNAYNSGRTLLLRRYTHSDRQWHSSNSSEYASCNLDAWFNEEYFNSLATDIRGQIAAVTIPYTPGHGCVVLSSLSRKVFAVSATELGGTHQYLNAEGTALANTATLKIATDSSGNRKTQWTRSPNISSLDGVLWIFNTAGNLTCHGSVYVYASRPAFTLPSSLGVDDNGNIVVNEPPVISGSDRNLGTYGESFTAASYSVTDPENDACTVVERLDGKTLRTFSPTLGSTYSVSLIGQTWQKVGNGSHTVTVTAEDSAGNATVRTLTFTKSVVSMQASMAAVLPADSRPSKLLINGQAAVPSGANLKLEACNNGNDASPAWEDVSSALNTGEVYMFKNQTKTASSWGVKIRFSGDRGSSGTACSLSAIGGTFG